MTLLEVQNLSKQFDLEKERLIALRDVSFEVNEGEFFTIIGPSGCGKSTLLRTVAGLYKQTRGRISWSQRPKIGFVFQNYALFPFLTVYENIEFGLKMQAVGVARRKEIVNKLIKEIDLVGFEDKHPLELSGGMRQRVGIARALAVSPNILFLDEPFSSLDELTAEVLRKLLLDIWKKQQITIILITHLISEAIELSDRIAVMGSAPGTIREIFIDNLPRPRNKRSAQFYELEDRLSRLLK